MTTGGGDTRTRSSIFWAMVFSRGDRRIDSASTSSTSARPFPTKRGSRSARRFEAGICIYAVTSPSKICRVCSIQRSVAGCNTTGGITARRYIRTCVNWTVHWPIGPIGSTRSCAVIYGGRHIGLRAFRVVIRRCSLTGRWACGAVPWREPYELRGSSTVLREPRGEIPWGYSPCRAIALPGQTSVWLDRIEAGAGVESGDQSGQDACDQAGRGEGESGLSGFHILLVPRPVWPRQPVFACGTVEEGAATGTGQADGDDGQSSMP